MEKLPVRIPIRAWRFQNDTADPEKDSKALLKFDLQLVLPHRGKLRAVLRDIKNVGRSSAFRIDQADFDIEAMFGERGADVVQKAWAIESHDLDHCAVRGALVVHVNSGFHAYLWRPFFRLKFSFHEGGDVQFTRDRGNELLLEPGYFRRIMVECLEAV